MAVKAFDLIIFDMDGTLLASMGCLADWLHRAVKNYCPASVTPATIAKAFGPTEGQIIAQFVKKDTVQVCLNTYYDLYEREHDRIYVYPGIDELLKTLRSLGIPMALCTGKSRRAVDISLKRLSWDSCFQVVITGDDTECFKPDPEGLNRIMVQIPAERKRTLFIGDSPADIGAADNAGIFAGLAEWGMLAHSTLVNTRPNFQFKTPQAVLDLVDE